MVLSPLKVALQLLSDFCPQRQGPLLRQPAFPLSPDRYPVLRPIHFNSRAVQGSLRADDLEIPHPEPLHQVEHRSVDVVPGLGFEPPLESVGLRGLDNLELRVRDVEKENPAPDLLELLLGPHALPIVHELGELPDGPSVVVPSGRLLGGAVSRRDVGLKPTLDLLNREEANVLLRIHKPLVGATRNRILDVDEVAQIPEDRSGLLEMTQGRSR